jgi:hypothetical protein
MTVHPDDNSSVGTSHDRGLISPPKNVINSSCARCLSVQFLSASVIYRLFLRVSRQRELYGKYIYIYFRLSYGVYKKDR